MKKPKRKKKKKRFLRRIAEAKAGFNIGALKYSVSLVFGGYTGEYNSADDDDYELPEGGVHWTDEFSPTIVAIGGNLTLKCCFY